MQPKFDEDEGAFHIILLVLKCIILVLFVILRWRKMCWSCKNGKADQEEAMSLASLTVKALVMIVQWK